MTKAEMSEYRIIPSDKINELIIKMANDANNSLIDNMENIHPDQTYLIYSRALNLLFTRHYHLSISAANKQIEAKETK